MRRLFFLLNLYIATSLLICSNNDNQFVEVDPTTTLPYYNCTLNVTEENLINMTSKNSQLKIIGTQMNLQENIFFSGFQTIEFFNITIDTQTYKIQTENSITFTNVTFINNSGFEASLLRFSQCVMIKQTFRHKPAFNTQIEMNGMIIQDTTFLNSSLSSFRVTLIDIVFDQVNFIQSSLGNLTQLQKLIIRNSFIVQSILIEQVVLQEITIQNCFFTQSTIIIGKDITKLYIQNITLSQSTLLNLMDNGSVYLNQISFYDIKSTDSIINVQTPSFILNNVTLKNIITSQFIIYTGDDLEINELNINNHTGNFIKGINTFNLVINNFIISNSFYKSLFHINGTITLNKGNFDQNNERLLQSNGISLISLNQISFSNLNNLTLFNLQNLNHLQLQSIIITNCSNIIFIQGNFIQQIRIDELSLQECLECQLLQINNSNIDIEDSIISNIINTQYSLMDIQNSNFDIKHVNTSNITTQASEFIIINESDNLQFIGINFSNISCPNCNSIISISNCQTVGVSKSIFSNSIANLGFWIVQDTISFSVYNNTFQNIQAQHAGAIVSLNTSIQIFFNYFSNTSAELGNAIYVQHVEGKSYLIDQNQYDSYQDENVIYLETNEISLPTSYTYIAGPVYVDINNTIYSINELIQKNNFVYFDQVKSGNSISFSVAILNSNKSRLCNIEEDLIINQTIIEFNNKLCQYNVTYINYQSDPKNESTTLYLQLNKFTIQDVSAEIPIILNMIECSIGEEWVEQTCQKCSSGTYSLDNYSECMQCINQMETCPGGSEIIVRSGYWRANTQSDEIAQCKQQPSNCQGGNGSFTCSQGNTGALCSDCDYYAQHWENSYTMDVYGNCTVCQSDAFNISKIILSFAWILIALFISVRGSLKLCRQQLTGHYLRLMGIYFATRSTMVIDQTEIVIKLVSTYFQLISIIMVIDFDFPTPLSTIAQAIGNPLQSLGYSIECFLLSSNINIPIVYLRQFWNLFVSISVILIFVVVYALIKLSIPKKTENSIFTIYVSSMIQVYFYFQGDIIEGLLQLMFCIKVTGIYYIQAATSYLCYTDEYYTYLKSFVIPILVIVGIIMPLFYIVKLYNYKNKLWTCSLRLPYGYLFVEYKDKYYYWEFICFLVKSIFYLLETLLNQDIHLMFLLAILTLIIYLELLNRHQPYIDKSHNSIDKTQTLLAIVTLILSYSQDNNPYIGLVYFTSILCSILNVIFCIYIAYNIIRETITSLRSQHVEKIINIIIRYPCLKHCIKKTKHTHSKRNVGLLWKKARIYVIQFISELKLQKSNVNLNPQDMHSSSTTHRPASSSTSASRSLLNSMTPMLLKLLKQNKISQVSPAIEEETTTMQQNPPEKNDITTVISAYIDPNNSVDASTPIQSIPKLPKKSTITTVFQYIKNQ